MHESIIKQRAKYKQMNSFVQVAVPILDGKNYLRWSKQMQVLFEYHQLLIIVEVGVPTLPENTTEEQRIAHQMSIKKDKQALYFIQQGLTDEVFEMITNASTAKQAWGILRTTFNRVDGVKYSDHELQQQSKLEKNMGNMDQRLHDAAISKKIDCMNVIKVLNEEDYELLQGTTAQGNTALHLAIRFGNLHFAKRIYDLYPNLLKQANMIGETPLHYVAACGLPFIWHWFVDVINIKANNADINIKRALRKRNYQGETVLHVALKNRNETMAKSLLEVDFGLSNCINNAGESVIYLAANFGYIDIVKTLLESSSTANHIGLLGQSPLHAAIGARNIEMVRVILDKRPGDTKHTDENGCTPLHYAVLQNNVYLVETLLKHDPSTAYDVSMDGNSSTHLATQMGFIQVLEKILDHCPDCIDVVDTMGRNILHVAIDNKNLNIVKCILNRYKYSGVVNKQDANGNTSLHIACYNCEVDIIKELLLEPSMNRKLENYKGHTGHKAFKSLSWKADNNLKHVQTGVLLDEVYLMDDEVPKKKGENIVWQFIKTYRRSAFDNEKYLEKVPIIATLIAAVTFTAVFAIPGGYFQDGPNEGLAILSNKSSFKYFIVFDTLALFFSLIAIMVSTYGNGNHLTTIRLAGISMSCSLLLAIAAFGAGVYVVVAPLSLFLANFVRMISYLPFILYGFAISWWRLKLLSHLQFARHIVKKLKKEHTRHVTTTT